MKHIYRRKPRLVQDSDANSLQQMIYPHVPKTFIMRWNTDISNHTLQDFESSLKCYVPGEYFYDWSVWDYDKIAPGDKVYMVRSGQGRHGVVLMGTVMNWPYMDDDWRGTDRVVYYVRICVERLFHPEKDFPFLSTDLLAAAIPDFNWEDGHSGELLSDEQAAKLDEVVSSYLNDVVCDNVCNDEIESADQRLGVICNPAFRGSLPKTCS